MFITEYTSAVRLLYHKHYPLIMTTVGDSIFQKIFKTILERKILENYYFYPAIKMMKLNLTL